MDGAGPRLPDIGMRNYDVFAVGYGFVQSAIDLRTTDNVVSPSRQRIGCNYSAPDVRFDMPSEQSRPVSGTDAHYNSVRAAHDTKSEAHRPSGVDIVSRASRRRYNHEIGRMWRPSGRRALR